MNALRAAVALVGLMVFSAAAAGCAQSIEGLYPPAPAELVKPIYVINHGWHTGIAVRRADIREGAWPEPVDLADSEYVEVGWGNREFYMAPEGTLGLALKAVLWPSPAVLHVVGFDGPVSSSSLSARSSRSSSPIAGSSASRPSSETPTRRTVRAGRRF
jgi:hypothetical protein